MATTILSINGNRPMNYVLKNVFSERFNLIAVNNVSEAIFLLKKKNIGLIIVDLDSNAKDNLDFINYLQNSWLYQKPVMVLAANKKTVDMLDEELSSHAILKPFNPVELIKKAEQILGKTIHASHLINQ